MSVLLSSYLQYTNKLASVRKCVDSELLHSLHLLWEGTKLSHVKVSALCCMSESVSQLNFSINCSHSELIRRGETAVWLAV